MSWANPVPGAQEEVTRKVEAILFDDEENWPLVFAIIYVCFACIFLIMAEEWQKIRKVVRLYNLTTLDFPGAPGRTRTTGTRFRKPKNAFCTVCVSLQRLVIPRFLFLGGCLKVLFWEQFLIVCSQIAPRESDTFTLCLYTPTPPRSSGYPLGSGWPFDLVGVPIFF